MKFTMTLTLAALGLSMSGSALAIDYSSKDCTNGGDCNLPGMLVSALSGGTQAEAKALCGTQVYGDTRCHQNTQAKAEEICSKYPECTAIVQDTVGYEPRSGDIINHHPAAKRMWQKILDPNGYSHTDCTNGGDCNLPGMLVTALSAGAQAQAKELCGTQVYGDERCHQNTKAKAEEICAAFSECTGIVRDSNGLYEPRSGNTINHHPNALMMWTKNKVEDCVSETFTNVVDNSWSEVTWADEKTGIFNVTLNQASNHFGAWGNDDHLIMRVRVRSGNTYEWVDAAGHTERTKAYHGARPVTDTLNTDLQITGLALRTPTWTSTTGGGTIQVCNPLGFETFTDVADNSWSAVTWTEEKTGKFDVTLKQEADHFGAWGHNGVLKMRIRVNNEWVDAAGRTAGGTAYHQVVQPIGGAGNVKDTLDTDQNITGIALQTPTWGRTTGAGSIEVYISPETRAEAAETKAAEVRTAVLQRIEAERQAAARIAECAKQRDPVNNRPFIPAPDGSDTCVPNYPQKATCTMTKMRVGYDPRGWGSNDTIVTNKGKGVCISTAAGECNKQIAFNSCGNWSTLKAACEGMAFQLHDERVAPRGSWDVRSYTYKIKQSCPNTFRAGHVDVILKSIANGDHAAPNGTDPWTFYY